MLKEEQYKDSNKIPKQPKELAEIRILISDYVKSLYKLKEKETEYELRNELNLLIRSIVILLADIKTLIDHYIYSLEDKKNNG